MVSWLYGLLLGLGIASVILAVLCLFAGPPIIATAWDNKRQKITGIVILSLLPVFLIIGIVLLSVTLSVGKI